MNGGIEMKKLKEVFKKFKVRALMFATVATVAVSGLVTFAEDPSPAPLISAADLGIVTTFGNQVKAAIPIMLLAIVPLGLAIWILPTSINKGLGMVKSAVNKLKFG